MCATVLAGGCGDSGVTVGTLEDTTEEMVWGTGVSRVMVGGIDAVGRWRVQPRVVCSANSL